MSQVTPFLGGAEIRERGNAVAPAIRADPGPQLPRYPLGCLFYTLPIPPQRYRSHMPASS